MNLFIKTLIITAFVSMSSVCSYAQKIISECTVTYAISTQSENAAQSDPLSGATNIISIKGSLSRTDMTSPLGKETTIYDEKNGSGVILKEYSGQKLMVTLTKSNWITLNSKFEGINFVNTSETKTIAGFNCIKATGKLNDGAVIVVFYAPDMVINNKDYNKIFKNLAGLPVQYEFENGKLKFKYLLTAINYGAVPVSKFDFPKAGYRVMSYDESKQGK